jgi:hypothetical protein
MHRGTEVPGACSKPSWLVPAPALNGSYDWTWGATITAELDISDSRP